MLGKHTTNRHAHIDICRHFFETKVGHPCAWVTVFDLLSVVLFNVLLNRRLRHAANPRTRVHTRRREVTTPSWNDETRVMYRGRLYFGALFFLPITCVFDFHVVVLPPDPLSLQTLICRFCRCTDTVWVFIFCRVLGAKKYVTRPHKLEEMNSVYYSLFYYYIFGWQKKRRDLIKAPWNHIGSFVLLLHSFQRQSLRFHPIPLRWPPFSPPFSSLFHLSCPLSTSALITFSFMSPPLSLFPLSYCILLSLSSPSSPFISC